MEIKLKFSEDILFDSIYDTLSLFFRNQDNVERILEEDKHEVLLDLAEEIKYIISDTIPNEIEVI